MVSDELVANLIEEAANARKTAYAVYSDFMVGAALLARNDAGEAEVFTGSNVENSSYGAAMCAERVAAGCAVSSGYRHFEAIAIIGGDRERGISEMTYPCGICRQVLSEFGRDMYVIAAENRESYRIMKLTELMPMGFALPEK